MPDNHHFGNVPASNGVPVTYVGACFCGAVQIEAEGAPLQMGYCHCASCRSYSGAPLSAFALWDAAGVRITKGAETMGRFNKTGFSERCFCSSCGGHIMTVHPTMGGAVDVRAAVLPALTFVPTVHLNYAETVMPIFDGLPKLRDFPTEAGGTGELMPEVPAAA